MNILLRSAEFDAWLRVLEDDKAKARILARLTSAALGNFGDCEPVGAGVSEMRIHVGPRLPGLLRAPWGEHLRPVGWRRQVHAETRYRSRAPNGSPVEGDEALKQTYAPFDAAHYLDDDVVVAEYLTAAAEDPNPDVFLAALGDVAKARGMAEIAKEAGLGRESLYKALGAGAHPRYETVSAVLRALGVKVAMTAEVPRHHKGLKEPEATFEGPPANPGKPAGALQRLTATHLDRLYKPVGEIIVQWAITDATLQHLAFAMFKVIGTTPEKQKWPVMFGPRLQIIERLFADRTEFRSLRSSAKSVIKYIRRLQVLRDMLVHGVAVRYELSKDAVIWHRIDRSAQEQRQLTPAITHVRNSMLVRYSMLSEASDGCFAVNATLLKLRDEVEALG